MDNIISELMQSEDEKKRLRHEKIIRQFKEYFAQEAREEQIKKEFEKNGRDFEYVPDVEMNSPRHRYQRPNFGSQNIWSSPIRASNEGISIFEDYNYSPSASAISSSGSPSGSTLSNYFSFTSPLSNKSLTSSPRDELFKQTSSHHQLFSSSHPDSSGLGSSPLAKPLYASSPKNEETYEVPLKHFVQPEKKTVSTQTDDSVVVAKNEILTSSVFKNAARETVQKYKTKMHCVFCMKNKDHERVYSSHNLKDSEGRITCPVLRNYVCPKCGATGDSAHTISYCTEKPRF